MGAPPDPNDVWTLSKSLALSASLLPPVLISVFGTWWTLRRETTQRDYQAFSKVIEKRVSLWDEIGPKLNDIYCYFLYVGHWKELRAPDLIKRKRELDKAIFAYRPFFTDEFFQGYMALMDTAFSPHEKFGQDARLRTSRDLRPESDAERFTGEGQEAAEAVHRDYFALLELAATELRLKIDLGSKAPKLPEPSKVRRAA